MNKEINEILKFVEESKEKLGSALSNIDHSLGIKRYIKIADETLQILKRGRILDWGCGYGQVSYLLLKRGFEVVSYEVGEFSGKGPGSPLLNSINQEVVYNVERVKLPFEGQSFDAVLSCGVLEHVENYEGSLSEISRILKTGGYFFIYMLPNLYSYIETISSFFGRSDHPVKFSKLTINELLEKNSFEVVKSGYQNFLPYNLKRVPTAIRETYKKLGFLIEPLDEVLVNMPILNLLSTNIKIVVRKK